MFQLKCTEELFQTIMDLSVARIPDSDIDEQDSKARDDLQQMQKVCPQSMTHSTVKCCNNYYKQQIEQIMYQQKLSFNGYMRINLLNDLSQDASRIMTNDVVMLCCKFYTLDIKSIKTAKQTEFLEDDDYLWMKYDSNKVATELYTLHVLCNDLQDNHEYFIGHKLLKECMKYDEIVYDKGVFAQSLDQLGTMIFEWNVETQNDRIFFFEAIEYHKEVLALESYCDKKLLLGCMNALAACYKKLSDYHSAEEIYSALSQKDPDNAEVKYLFSGVLRFNDKYEEAVKNAIQSFEETESKHAEYALEVARCFEGLDQYNSAEEYYLKAIELNEEKNGSFCNYYGEFLRDCIRDCEKAKTYFIKAMQIEPKDCNSYYELAKLYRDNIKDYKESEKYYLKCLEINDRDYGNNGSYGYLLYLMGDYDKALEYIKIELDIDDKNNWAHFYHGLVHKVLGNDGIAEISLWKALSQCRVGFHKDHLRYIEQINDNNETLNEFFDRFKNMLIARVKLIKNANCKLL